MNPAFYIVTNANMCYGYSNQDKYSYTDRFIDSDTSIEDDHYYDTSESRIELNYIMSPSYVNSKLFYRSK